MENKKGQQSIVSAIMEAVGLLPRKRQSGRGMRYLGLNGAFGSGDVRHCSTWDFDYKLPRPVQGRRSTLNDFKLR